MLHTLSPEIKDMILSILCRDKVDSLKKGDFKAFQEASELISFVKLDPADPEYKQKLRAIYSRLRFRKLVTRAEEVIQRTGKPIGFEDARTAISDAIDAAAERFERTPCPKHAADLLGLIDCRNCLIDANTEETDETETEEEDDE